MLAEDKITKFERNYINSDGTTEVWRYDLNKFKNGPIEVTINYPKGYKSPLETFSEEQKDLPITKQKFLNPTNGKLVGYTRAKNLGLI